MRLPTPLPTTRAGRSVALIFAIVAACGPAIPVGAQSVTIATQQAAGLADPITRIDLYRSDVFDTTESSAWYARGANKLHINTQENVIRRESLLSVGQPYDSARGAETVRNLRKLGVFSTVALDTTRDSGLVVTIRTQDAWTTKPFVSYKSSGSQAIWGFGLREENLLGRLIGVLVSYRHEPDRTTKKLAVSAPRILADRITLAGVLENFSDGRHDSLGVAFPFLSLSAPKSAFITGEVFAGDVLRYFSGEHTASDTLKRRYAIGRASIGRALNAGDRGYLRIAFDAQYRRDDFAPLALSSSMGRTETAALFSYLEWDRADFAAVKEYRNLGPIEDIDLSTTIRVGSSFAPGQWGYGHTGFGPLFNLRTAGNFSRGFVTLGSVGSSMIGPDGLDSGTVTVDVTGFLAPLPRHSLILHADGGWSKNPVPGQEFDLGLSRGPRAFPNHAFTGDRSFVTMGEYRWLIMPNIANLVSVAVAGFADHGGAWYNGSAKRTGTDFGAGFRFGSIRLPSVAGALRLDAAYRLKNDVEPAGWVLVFGSGLAFEKPLK